MSWDEMCGNMADALLSVFSTETGVYTRRGASSGATIVALKLDGEASYREDVDGVAGRRIVRLFKPSTFLAAVGAEPQAEDVWTVGSERWIVTSPIRLDESFYELVMEEEQILDTRNSPEGRMR